MSHAQNQKDREFYRKPTARQFLDAHCWGAGIGGGESHYNPYANGASAARVSDARQQPLEARARFVCEDI